MVKRQEKSVLKNLIVKNTLFLLFYSTLIKIYFTPDFIEPRNLTTFFNYNIMHMEEYK